LKARSQPGATVTRRSRRSGSCPPRRLLTFSLVNYGKVGDRPERALTRWNATEVYKSIDGRWRIIHSHWSYVQPLLRQEGS